MTGALTGDTFLVQNPAIDAIYPFQQQLHQLLISKSLNQQKWALHQ